MQMCVIELKERPGRPLFHLEHYIEGKYIKYNSNSGFVRDDNVRLTPQVGPCRAPCPISADLGPLQITIGLPFLSLPLYTPPYRERPPTWAELGYLSPSEQCLLVSTQPTAWSLQSPFPSHPTGLQPLHV